MKTVYELNIDGLVGPTHHYAGLATGNIASATNALRVASPKKAALQGLKKMRLLHQLGIKQAVLPPHQRPNLQLLEQLGFTGTPAQKVTQAKHEDMHLLSACYSASSMWTANAATISSSLDTDDKRVHFTAANLIGNLHRHQESAFSAKMLQLLFNNKDFFKHHTPLPSAQGMGDEGAANHSRICENHHHSGLNVFVYGKHAFKSNITYPEPKKYPARQTYEASSAIARKHLLNKSKTFFFCQNPDVIDQGVFHNDVIAVANENVLIVHQDAFLNQADALKHLNDTIDFPFHLLEVERCDISVSDAVKTYLFNSQLITLPDGKMALISPIECEQQPLIKSYIDNWLSSSKNPVESAYYLDLRQSMRNGGGPACLRLRVPLTQEELSAMHPGVIINDALINELEAWVEKHYRTTLHVNDLADPELINETFFALDELTSILNIGNVYPFQIE